VTERVLGKTEELYILVNLIKSPLLSAKFLRKNLADILSQGERRKTRDKNFPICGYEKSESISAQLIS
jgi:hypothetical protein